MRSRPPSCSVIPFTSRRSCSAHPSTPSPPSTASMASRSVDELVEPQFASDETTTLVEFLDYYRAVLLRKVDGISDVQARLAPCPPSPLNLMGLVRHMADVERNWFRRTLS